MSIPYASGPYVATSQEDLDALHTRIKFLQASADLEPLGTLHNQVLLLLLHTLLFGILTVLEFTALWLLGSKALKRTAALFMIVTTLVMYIATAINWGVIIHDVLAMIPAAVAQLTAVNNGLASFDAALMDGTGLGGTPAIAPMRAPHPGSTAQIQQCATTVSLIVNMTLGDAIVLWRASVLWSTRRGVLLLPSVLLFATFAAGVVNIAAPCQAAVLIGDPATHGDFGAASAPQRMPVIGNAAGTLAAGALTILLTLSTNLCVTTLIALKALEHRHSVAQYLRGGSRRTQAEKVMIILVESGSVYCVIWIILAALELYTVTTADVADLGAHSGLSSATLAFIALIVRGCLIPLIAIYPTLIVLLVALNKTPCESHCTIVLGDAPGAAIEDLEPGSGSSRSTLAAVPELASISSSQCESDLRACSVEDERQLTSVSSIHGVARDVRVGDRASEA